ncbi:MAG: GDSL-type esterase/lipase family protein [Bacteroidota bacterium]
MKRLLPWTLLILLLGSIVAWGLLYQLFYETYLEEQRLRLDPMELTQYGSERIPVDSPLVVLFGDSRAEGWISPNVPVATVVNRGIGGQTTAQLLGRMQQDVLSLKPDVVVFQAGINDLKMMAYFPGRAELIQRDCQENIWSILQACREQDIPVVVSTLFPHGDIELLRRLFWDESVEEAVGKLNAELVRWADQDEGLHLLDTWPLLASDGKKVDKAYQKDFLHLRIGGYARLNEGLEPLLQEILLTSPTP